MKVLAMDIGGTFLKYALYEDENVLVSGKTPSRAAEGAEALWAVLLGLGEAFRGQFDGIAVATAGTVGPEGQIVYANENISGYTGVPLKKWLEETFSVPAAVLNDVAAAAYALTDTFEDYFFIALGTGVGGAYVHRRQLMNGGTGFGGQIGYLPMKNGSTADQTASSAALARRAGEAGERVFEKAGQGDERAARILDEWLDDVAQVILAAEIVTGAEAIVLGGGVSAQGESLLSPLRSKLDRMETPYRGKFRLTIAPDGNASGTLGARKYFEESLRREK